MGLVTYNGTPTLRNKYSPDEGCGNPVPKPAAEVQSASLDSTDLKLVIGLTVACVFLLAFIAFATVFLRMAKKKRATRGTYSPSNQEMFGSRVEMNPVMKPPPEERLI
ncbi:hypothetical protein HPB47_007298 [Ixodes persulcatus]|uniref:Uncharacterized protein n=1 Tax=Ixodes persulcatus TaxID=34615 RepID=A0AC60P8T0_IXOPE|nr:hypothetical protein HPB47_007298 [Ixodes persulcatus]